MTNTKKAFTLVELIVVMAVLIILGTISIIGYSTYNIYTRDANRNSNLAKIKDGLEVYKGMYNYLPVPDNYIQVKAGTGVINYQGYAGKTILSELKILGGGVDPKDNINFTYSTDVTKTNYELMTFLEDRGNLLSDNFITGKTNAVDYTTRTPAVTGGRVGILTQSGTNTPIQEITSLTSGLDITTTASGYSVYFTNNDIVSGTGLVLTSVFSVADKTISNLDKSLVGYWDMETLSGTMLKDFSSYGNHGTLSGSISVGNADGKIGYATNINGIGNSLSSYIGTYIGSNNSLSVSSWIYISQNSSGPVVGIAGNQNGGGWNMPFISVSGYNAYGWIWNVAGNNPISYILKEGWHNLAITYNPNNGGIEKFYVDGIFISSGVGQYGAAGTGVYFSTYITGSKPSGVNSYFNGIIDDIRIYNRDLSSDEIENLYNTTSN